jgi:Zn-dependent protease
LSHFQTLLALSIDGDALRRVGIYVVCLVLSVAVHEFCHAFAAHKLGDGTPESEGRLTLNPVSHVDVIGTLALPLFAGLFGWPLFGWGKPVPTQPRNYTRKVSMRKGLAIVAVAGPLGNLALMVVVVAIAALISLLGFMSQQLNDVLLTLAFLNLILMVFNLIPLHPLDGGKILAAFLPAKFAAFDQFSQRYGGYVLIGLVVLGGSVLALAFAPFQLAMNWVWGHAVGVV